MAIADDRRRSANDRDLANSIKRLLNCGHSDPPKKLAVSVIALIRASYPFGINLLDPRWASNEVAYRGDQPVSLTLPSNLSVLVTGDELSLKEGAIVRKSVPLELGRAYIIGRRLVLNEMLAGASLQSCVLEPDLKVSSRFTGVSRTALMVIKTEGGLYFMDRGSRYGVTINIGDSIHHYQPVVVRDPNGAHSIGVTIVDQYVSSDSFLKELHLPGLDSHVSSGGSSS